MRTRYAAVVLLVGAAAALAQDKPIEKPVKKQSAEPVPVIVRTQLPKGWKALGLSPTQQKEILTTRAKFAVKRQALEEQIRKLRDEEMADLEKVLTASQKQRLKELRSK